MVVVVAAGSGEAEDGDADLRTVIMLSGARILVADDDPLLLDAVGDAFARHGGDVSRAGDGAALIDRLAVEGPFDLVVTDVSMPWMSGLRAMRATRTIGLGTSVIVMTALDDARIPSQVRALGRNAVFLRKPLDLAQLITAASTLLAQHARRRMPAMDR